MLNIEHENAPPVNSNFSEPIGVTVGGWCHPQGCTLFTDPLFHSHNSFTRSHLGTAQRNLSLTSGR